MPVLAIRQPSLAPCSTGTPPAATSAVSRSVAIPELRGVTFFVKTSGSWPTNGSHRWKKAAAARIIVLGVLGMWPIAGSAESGTCHSVANIQQPQYRAGTAPQAELAIAPSGAVNAVEAIEIGIRQTEALEHEREKTDKLTSELGFVRTELEMARLGVMSARHEAALVWEVQLEQERNKSRQLTADVARFQEELDLARVEASDSGRTNIAMAERSLRSARDTKDALAVEQTKRRGDVDKARAAAAAADQALAQAAQQRRELESQLAQLRERGDDVARELNSRQILLEAADAKAAEEEQLRRTLQTDIASERERSVALAQELALLRSQIADRTRHPASAALGDATNVNAGAMNRTALLANDAPGVPKDRALDTTIGNIAPPTNTPGEVGVPVRPAPTGNSGRVLADEPRLLARANLLLRNADISAARTVLEHAVERGSARAAFMLAETFDVRVLQSWGARGVSGDFGKARELYERASAGGIDDAKERLRTLH